MTRDETDKASELTYAAAGVNISAGEEAVARIRSAVKSTYRPEVLGDIGGFGGLFALDSSRWSDPVLVSATDGVGTKALVAEATGRLDTIGIDLVAMCVDDLVCQGAEPLLFLDYISMGRLRPDRIEALVGGIAAGCREVGCALVGGEMAEHPDAMDANRFELVGFALGVVDRSRLIGGDRVTSGDVLIGLPSPGLRSNGYSLARKALLDVAALNLDDPAWEGADQTLADELLRPSVLYAPTVLAVLASGVDLHAVAHITGGGLPGNLVRVLGRNHDAMVQAKSWTVPRIFSEIQRLGSITDEEMASAFNMGVGMVLVVAPSDVDQTIETVSSRGLESVVLGSITVGSGRVRLS